MLDVTCIYIQNADMLAQDKEIRFTDARLSAPSEGLSMHVRHGPLVPVRRAGAAFIAERKGPRLRLRAGIGSAGLALTDAEIEAAALYRTLRQLEKNAASYRNGIPSTAVPRRRVFALTPRGEEHLSEWVAVLEHMSKSMTRLVMSARVELGKNDGRSKSNRDWRGAASGRREVRFTACG